MQRFQQDFSAIILDEIALEGLDGITIEALCKRLSNNFNWPLKPVDDTVKTIIWSFVVHLKNIEFYRLEHPRDPLIIFNRFEYTNGDFGSLYEPGNVPKDIYPNHPIEDGLIMGSCNDYYTRFNLGSFPRKISIEEAEKRWGRCLVIVASQELRTNVLIPQDKQCTLNISLRYYLVLERIGRSRYLGEASYGACSLRTIFSNAKSLSYVRSRLTDDGLIKNQTIAFSGNGVQVANSIIISSLARFFIKKQSKIDKMVSRIVEYLKIQPNLLASYEQVKSECNISLAKTFKLPQLKKYCDTNLMVKYRELFPNANKSEYLNKKNPQYEKVIRCIRLKCSENKKASEELEKKTIEGREFKQDCAFERQILRWIERQGDSGVTLSDISRAFRFTTDCSLDKVLKKLTNLNYLTKTYCDRGRTKVFSYIANSYNSVSENDNIKTENLPIKKNQEPILLENSLNLINDVVVDTTVNEMNNVSIEKQSEQIEIKEDCTSLNSSQNVEICNIKTDIDNFENEVLLYIQSQDKNSDQCESTESKITQVIEHGYCKSVYENYKQTVSLTDRFYFRKNIIFNMLSTENVINLPSLKKNIIETEKECPKFIGTLDIKTLVKILGYFEKMGSLKTVQYRITYDTKTVNQIFVGNSSVDFNSPETMSYMNSFLNRFNNIMKTTKAIKKWNLTVQKSPSVKINISDLKLPRFMKMRSLHEYLYYIVYDHPGESLMNACNETEATVANYRNDILHGDSVELPKVYYPAIGWKMFVPPLQKYQKYPDGWFFVSDIIHHMPLELMLKIVNFNKSKVNLDKLVNYATHPVFKYLPLMSLSSEVTSMLSQGQKKHIRNTLNSLRLLCTIGLIQFGEKMYKDTELIYAYLNRKASLLNTVKSSPNYYRISDMDYERRTYEFISSYELETFWLDTWYFCTNTPLGFRIIKSTNKPKRQDIIERSKIAIENACISRGILEAAAQDDGMIPGDNKGAAGFDSHLFAHLARNWSIKKKFTVLPARKKTKFNLSLIQRMKKHANYHKKSEKKISEIANNHLFKMRHRWTTAEDQVLLFWKLGVMFIKQVKSHAFLSYGIKDVVRSVFGKLYCLKSVDNYLRRLRYLMRYPSIEANVNILYEELKVDKEMHDIFKANIEKQHELYNTKKFKAMRDLIVMDIKTFVEILRERGTTINTQCIITGKKKKTNAQPLCIIKQEVDNSNSLSDTELMETQYTFSDIVCQQQESVQEIDYLFTVNDVHVSVINSLIHSSLSNQSTDPRISLSYLQAFKQYPDDILRQSFNAIKESNIITCSQYHKESLQIVLSTSHVIQSRTYDYGPKFFTTLVGNTDVGRYKDAFVVYSAIKEDLLEQKMLLLYPSRSLCTTLTSLSLMNIIDISIEFDKKYLEYMPNENVDGASMCLKNTLKRMRSRHFILLSSTNDSVEYIKIVTSITKQLKNYRVMCKLKQSSLLNFEEEMDSVMQYILCRPIFEPKVKSINDLNEFGICVLEFCNTKGFCGASQQNLKEHFAGVPLGVLAQTLKSLIDKDLVLKAGIEVPSYVHYQHADLWLVKISKVNNSSFVDDILLTELTSEDTETMEPPLKKMRGENSNGNVNVETTITQNYIIVRPWTRLDSTINKEVLHKFLNSILSKIIVKPGIYMKTLIKEYYPILQPMHTRELIEVLEAIRCVTLIHLKNTTCKPSFFSDPLPLHQNLIFSDVNGLEDESLIMLEPTLDCEIRFGYFSDKFTS